MWDAHATTVFAWKSGTALWSGSLLPLCGFWASNSGFQLVDLGDNLVCESSSSPPVSLSESCLVFSRCYFSWCGEGTEALQCTGDVTAHCGKWFSPPSSPLHRLWGLNSGLQAYVAGTSTAEPSVEPSRSFFCY